MTIFWFRRDLRIEDNAALYYALKESKSVQPIFIFDTSILNKLEDKTDPRVTFIHQVITSLKEQFNEFESDLKVYIGEPLTIFRELIESSVIDAIYTNRDYEPQAIDRDKDILELCQKHSIKFKVKKDQVIFDRSEIVKDDGNPYTVYTPYSKKWKANLNEFYISSYPTTKYLCNLKKLSPTEMPSLASLGFIENKKTEITPFVDIDIISKYDQTRDIPSVLGTSRLSTHLRFGTISIRKLVQVAIKTNEKWLNELVWRDFYQMILYHFPNTVESSFKPKYDLIEWDNNEDLFQKWCQGKTGYPIVDAGMRELNETGYMHNRVRMIVASFLTKHLLIDWKWGERYFAQKLMDFDLASNIGGWQWAAGSGCDAAPYFRVFNPYLQTEKFDPKHLYIKKWVPEFQSDNYPKPIIDHNFARKRVLEVYKEALV
ncbi:MAG: deoxyribodipyrimidine photo-lyase [Flavobacteriales bacterium]|nr:deoxyribodipyrimidine photo-lyase [Flavobacteriales bacterium]MCB9198246.1 deoxyribodipyrimidine photo-lyase [Flavobacteriales bacterium]